MKKVFFLLSIFYFLFSANVLAASPGATMPLWHRASADELKQTIEARLQELQKINAEIEQNQKELEEAQKQKATLNNQLKSLNYTIKQVDLGIKSSGINLQKLGLELESLSQEISSNQEEAAVKKETVIKLIRELQQKDGESLLVSFLKGRSLADSFLEAQTIIALNGELSAEVKDLQRTQAKLNAQFDAQAKKKSEVETENQNLKSRKTILGDQKSERTNLLAQTQNQEKLYQAQLEKLRDQQETLSEEIGKIEDELRRSFDASILPAKRPGVFAWPVVLKDRGGLGRITQHYGEISWLYRGKPHNGLDIGAPLGTPVMAADNGVVLAVDNNDRNSWQKYQYGKYVLIRHDNNLATLYAHLSNNSVVKEGDRVNRGQVIGYVGSTGFSTGPHLHFGAYWAPSILMKSIPPAAGLVPVGVIIDPEDYL